MPLGIAKGTTWEQEVVQLTPGDMLVLYTDGITEAQDGRETFFGKERLLEVVRANLGRPAQDVQDTLLAEVHEFVGDAPRFDDIALMVLVRDSMEEQADL
jgi:sigma-B regulation protein RsbU (phosphoserine phosphatase)